MEWYWWILICFGALILGAVGMALSFGRYLANVFIRFCEGEEGYKRWLKVKKR